jgi:hypothetical protein
LPRWLSRRAARGAATGRIVVNERPYAVGLDWRTPSERERSSYAAVSRFAQNEGAAYVAVHTLVSGDSQVAVGYQARGHAAGQPSLAAHIAVSAPATDVLAAFALEDGRVYLCAIKEGKIVSFTGDVVYDDPDVARETFDDQLSRSNWELVIAPTAWDAPGAESRELADFLYSLPRTRLRHVRARERVAGYAIAGLALVVGTYATWPTPAPRTPEPAETTETTATDTTPDAADVAPRTYAGMPQGAAVLRICAERMRDLPVYRYPGWTPSKVSCDAEAVEVHLEKQSGRAAWLRSAVDPDIYPEADITTGSARRSATIEFPHPVAPPRHPDEVTDVALGVAAAVDRLRRLASNAFIQADIQEDSGNESTSVRVVDLRDLPALRPYAGWLVEHAISTISFISFHPEDGHWRVRGKLYGNAN